MYTHLVKRASKFLIIFALFVTQPAVSEAAVYASAASGPIGQTTGVEISSGSWLAWGFGFLEDTTVTSIGGHMGFTGDGSIFGAIVPMGTDPSALPPNPDNITSDAIAWAIFGSDVPLSSNNYLPVAGLSGGPVQLNGGQFYALVFGSGKFGANGSAFMTQNNGFGQVTYSTSGNGDWVSTGQIGTRFFVIYEEDVNPVPLPAALPLFATGLGALGLLGWRRKKRKAKVAA